MIDLTEMDNRLAEHLTRIKRVDQETWMRGGTSVPARGNRVRGGMAAVGSFRFTFGRVVVRVAEPIIRVVPAGFHR